MTATSTPPPKGLKAPKRSLPAVFIAIAALALSSCDEQSKEREPYLAHVKVESVRLTPDVVRASGTGEVKARIESELSFKVSGRVISREVNVGDRVKAGDLLARLDSTEQSADLESAKAAVASQEATLRMASSVLARRKALTQTGALSQQDLDSAIQQFQSAQNDLDAAKARLDVATDTLRQTELRADADGTITVRGIEVGQVVQPSTSVFTLAHDGARDAAFNVQESVLTGNRQPLAMEVALVSDPSVRAKASIREVSPAIDRSLGTVRVKLAIENPPPAMSLGSPIVANVDMERQERINVPWQALMSKAGQPAVWTIDPEKKTSRLKQVEIQRYDSSKVVLSSGLQAGDLVVIEGAQFLRENQQVSFDAGVAR
ncbi:efflux RND transporter periplasmic adaptor subunit [Rhizobium rhizoryzae]|uniref:RND family efflux transporter MFP subunit n=1 Tax=Rhizobium rhizoryzae TaxID=451876 RepID=A0A7W6PR69_9HYPH|nr:efflux RND transporter periplasmic adaptor subunit [Rhizobium rhizoryzae]MBB4144253.1 RND family efflux transporter MFP subunit [Rhizobium rhizoryzae]